ncbi:hypothetical protein HBI56_227830 [Parastagonospora nodorum]|nr:hypothetical protein HBH56_160640 [Parastagonospora nodorum]KAH3931731.1 hypothetical protein HBH54_088590 [Parastagonospora nodorum]KAH3947506.1 hypothetical protein HBH53_115790 [Parastagonospora nodorum]KAH3969120.1 hypothetical protein HBH52_174400 [Parastagonospora nodorum]KAH3972845.1 hypothetical protein HBH51_102960 [Parastagonospora nodorum]
MIHRILDGDMKPVKEASSFIGREVQVQIELHPNIDRKLRKLLTCVVLYLPTMVRCTIGLASLLIGYATAQTSSVKVRWLEGKPSYISGVTFGLPWEKGQHPANATTFTASGNANLESWATAVWPDGSLKWTGHALTATESPASEYTIIASGPINSTVSHHRRQSQGVEVRDDGDKIVVNTGKIAATFPKEGNTLVSSIRSGNKTVGLNGHLVLRSQNGTPDDDEDGKPTGIEYFTFTSKISNVTVSKNTARALVTVQGSHGLDGESGHQDWLPFTVRFYLYANSEAIRIIHTIIYDGDSSKDFISGIGIRFDVPLADEEMHNRHVRIAGVDGGLLREAVKGITGLRRDPGAAVRSAQFNGTATPEKGSWDSRVTNRLQWIPNWSDFRLSQLSPDGFNLKKRTKAGQSWVKIPGGTRSGGLAYLGGATVGGLAVGLRDFWKKYPTSLDISNAATDRGSITMWLYSPQAGPMDLRPYHDGLGQDTYAKQLDALEITYEDYENGYNTPYGVGRTNELYLYAFDTTPSPTHLSTITNNTNNPPVLFPDPKHIRDTKAIGSYWNVPGAVDSAQAQKIEANMDFLVKFYENQVEQRRWYGFWDHGDIIHTYDDDRHQWRYDIGGYAWDNSELSPDLFFWDYFLRTGRPDVYRLAHDQVRHGGEVDSYHLGNFTGLGTRHGVQHWADSAKQARIATPVYRKAFYYISGGDERTGDIIREVLDVDQSFVRVDARRKVRDPSVVYNPDPKALYLNFGTDWAGIAQAYLIEWERQGPRAQDSHDKLVEAIKTYPKLKNGFVTGEALYNSLTGAWSPPPTDPGNDGNVTVSHLSGVFGVLETIDQLIDHFGQRNLTQPFLDAFLDYCYFYGASKAEQKARYGRDFGNLNLKQGHSRYTAYVANRRNNATLVPRVWSEYLGDGSKDGLAPNAPWKTETIGGSEVLLPIDEAKWVSTNAAALYGVAGIENLALVGAPDVSSISGNRTSSG